MLIALLFLFPVGVLADAAVLKLAPPEDVRSLLQTHQALYTEALRRKSTGPASFPNAVPTKALLDAKPLAWVHIPKTGSTFANALVGLPGMCPGLHESQRFVFADSYEMDKRDDELVDWNNLCPGAFSFLTSAQEHFAAMGTPLAYRTSYLHHSVAMFRQPEQRLLSAFKFEGGFFPGGGWGWQFPTPPSSVLEYAHFAQGCAVKMLTRTSYASGDLTLPANVDYTRVCQDNSTAVTSDEVALAVSRVGSAFAFVGITDEWSLSMCLLHATFGGDCRSHDFGNVNSRRSTTSSLYDTGPLQGFTDEPDSNVYVEALRVFGQRTQELGVTYTSCQPCFEAAGLPADD